MAENWVSWPETEKLDFIVKNGIISFIFGEGRQSLNILKVSKSTVFEISYKNKKL